MDTDCLAGYIYSLKKDGDDIPNASSINDISLKEVAKQLEADTEGAFINMVSIDVDEYAKAHYSK